MYVGIFFIIFYYSIMALFIIEKNNKIMFMGQLFHLPLIHWDC